MTDEQFTQLLTALGAIYTVLTDIQQALTPPEGEPPCQHPDEARQEMSTFREIHWRCKACGHIERYRRES